MRIYTRTGDAGETGLAGGRRVRKSHLRVEALGALDEANAAVGAARVHTAATPELDAMLEAVQHRLFDLGAEIADPAAAGRIGAEQAARVEQAIDALERELAPLRAFILPGGPPAAAALHLARTVVRRAERAVIRLHDSGEPVPPPVAAYLNRLSDLLFTAARYAARESGDVPWRKDG